jgi:hypothetical protein
MQTAASESGSSSSTPPLCNYFETFQTLLGDLADEKVTSRGLDFANALECALGETRPALYAAGDFIGVSDMHSTHNEYYRLSLDFTNDTDEAHGGPRLLLPYLPQGLAVSGKKGLTEALFIVKLVLLPEHVWTIPDYLKLLPILHFKKKFKKWKNVVSTAKVGRFLHINVSSRPALALTHTQTHKHVRASTHAPAYMCMHVCNNPCTYTHMPPPARDRSLIARNLMLPTHYICGSSRLFSTAFDWTRSL